MTFLEQLAIAVLSGGVVAWLTVQWSLKRFYSEKWWERKAEAYADTLDALETIRQWPEAQMAALSQGRDMHEVSAKRLREKHREAEAVARKQRAKGALILSEDAAAILDEAIGVLDELNWRMDFGQEERLNRESAAMESAIKGLREEARRDLNVG